MESKVRIILGILLTFSSTWLVECASLTPRHFRSVRDVELPSILNTTVTNTTTNNPKENVTNNKLITNSSHSSFSDNIDLQLSKNDNKTDNNTNNGESSPEQTQIVTKENSALTEKPKVFTEHFKSSDNSNYNNTDTKQNASKTLSTKEYNKGTSRSLKIDIEKYISPDFHNKNNVYTVPTSPEIEKYLEPNFDDFSNAETKPTSSKKYFGSTPNMNDYNIILTTPQSDIFDARFRQVTDKIKQNLDDQDINTKYSIEHDGSEDPTSETRKYDLTRLMENVQNADNDTDVFLQAKEFKNIDINSGEMRNKKDMEKGMTVDYKSSYMKTSVYPDAAFSNNLSSTNEGEKIKLVDVQPLAITNQSTAASYITKSIIPIKYAPASEEMQNSTVDIKTSITTSKPTKKPRHQFSLHNNTIETSAPENEIKPKKHFTSTTQPSLNPLHQTEKTTYIGPVIENSINISKRGSIKSTELQNQTITPRANVDFDKKNFSLPPSATVWTLVTVKNMPNDSNHEHEQNKWIKLTTPPKEEDITTIRIGGEEVIVTSKGHLVDGMEETTTGTTILNDYTSTISTDSIAYDDQMSTNTEHEISTMYENQNEISSAPKNKNNGSVNMLEKETTSQNAEEVSSIYEITTRDSNEKVGETTFPLRTTVNLESTESTTNEQTTKGMDLTTDKEMDTTYISPGTTSSFEISTTEISTTDTFHATDYQIKETSTLVTEIPEDFTTTAPENNSSLAYDTKTTRVEIFASTDNPTSNLFTTTEEIKNVEINATDNNELLTTDKTTENIIKTSLAFETEPPRVTQLFSTIKTKNVEVPATTIDPQDEDIEDNNFGNDDNDYSEIPAKKNGKNVTETHESELGIIHIDNGDPNVRTISNKSVENGVTKVSITTHRQPILSTMESENTTNDLTSSTEHLSDDDTTDENNSGMIAAIAISSVGGICLILLAGLLLVMRKRQKKITYRQRCRPVSLDAYSLDNVSVYNSVRGKIGLRTSKRSYGNPAFDDPVSISHQMNFQSLAKFADNMEAINAEFEEIPQVTARANEVPAGCETKNRYANIIPLPETRVFLKPSDNDPHSDYINANYVTGPKNTRSYYIACQAPLQTTVDDFWRMIWEQQSRVILMLTNLYENGIEKCADYLPPSEVLDCHRLFGDFQITLKKREVKEKYIISSLQLKNMVSNSWREVIHLWYLGWPERGVPVEANSLIAFLIEARSHLKAATNNNSTDNKTNETSNMHISGTNDVEGGPLVVHCSPGTGRTGTVIACDIAIRDFELTRSVDIPKIVYRVRRDRASAVQTREQYAFIYKVISLYATKLTGGAMDSI